MRYILAVATGIVMAGYIPLSPAQASCVNAPDCYCVLRPWTENSLLVEAKVVSLGPLVTLRVLGEPYHDPTGTLHDGWEIPGLSPADPFYGPELSIGSKGLFSVDISQMKISVYLLEEGGLLPCMYDADFPGATADQVAAAVLSEDCDSAVFQLGVQQGECHDTDVSCGCSGYKGGSDPPALQLILFVVVYFRRRWALH
jgi:hypothetical protein